MPMPHNNTAQAHIDAAIREEYHPFLFQQGSPHIRVHAARDGAVRHDDPLPRQMLRAAPHSPTDLPRRAWPTQNPGDLPIRNDFAVWDLPHDSIYLFKKRVHNTLFHNTKSAAIAALSATGTPGGTRTPDLAVRSRALYPAELQALIWFLILTHPAV